MYFKVQPAKKRYTDDEVYQIVKESKKVGIDTSFADTYLYTISNFKMVSHITKLLEYHFNKIGSATIFPQKMGIKVIIVRPDDL